jgi:hypothetical protein
MRSAYGRQISPPDYELTCVEPGSPMGELLRRYWQMVCPSVIAEVLSQHAVDGDPRRARPARLRRLRSGDAGQGRSAD